MEDQRTFRVLVLLEQRDPGQALLAVLHDSCLCGFMVTDDNPFNAITVIKKYHLIPPGVHVFQHCKNHADCKVNIEWIETGDDLLSLGRSRWNSRRSLDEASPAQTSRPSP